MSKHEHYKLNRRPPFLQSVKKILIQQQCENGRELTASCFPLTVEERSERAMRRLQSLLRHQRQRVDASIAASRRLPLQGLRRFHHPQARHEDARLREGRGRALLVHRLRQGVQVGRFR